MKLWTRVKRDANPHWEVAAAEPDYFEPTKLIRVKVKKPLGDNSRIKVKGNAINSGWERMLMPIFWVGGKQFKVRSVDKDTCALMVRLKATVRVPRLEAEHAEDIRKARKKEMSRIKGR